MNYLVTEFDGETGVENERSMTANEQQQLEADRQAAAALEAEMAAIKDQKDAARASAVAKLAALGLTEDEAKAIVGQ